jgi:hypothetical protein
MAVAYVNDETKSERARALDGEGGGVGEVGLESVRVGGREERARWFLGRRGSRCRGEVVFWKMNGGGG